MGLFHTCNTPCNTAYNTDFQNFARRDLGILGFLLLNPRHLGHGACSLLHKQPPPLLSSRYSALQRAASVRSHSCSNLATKTPTSWPYIGQTSPQGMAYHLCRNAEPHMGFGRSEPTLFSSWSDAGWGTTWILLPGTKTDMQMTTPKVCSGSWQSTQKAEFQADQLPKLAHISTNMSLHHRDVPEQRDLQQHL